MIDGVTNAGITIINRMNKKVSTISTQERVVHNCPIILQIKIVHQIKVDKKT